MFETSAAQALLGLDPDLGQLLTPERLGAAYADLRVPVTALAPGPWQPETLWPRARAGDVGLLVVKGVLTRELSVHDAPSAELFGPGDIIRTRTLIHGDLGAVAGPDLQRRGGECMPLTSARGRPPAGR